MMWFDVAVQDGMFGYQPGDRPFQGLVAVSAVLPGWRPVGLFDTGSGPAVLEFSNGESSGSWLLDAQLVRRGGSVAELPEEHKREFARAFALVVDQLLAETFRPLSRGVAPLASALEKINVATRTALFYLAASHAEAAVRFEPPADSLTQELPFLIEGLSVDLQEASFLGAASGGLRYPDPASGNPVLLRHSVLLNDFTFVYPLPSPGPPGWLACATGHYNTFLGLYDTASGVFLTRYPEIASRDFSGLRAWLPEHIVNYATLLREYLAEPSKLLAGFLRPPPACHLGHQLRDELSGLARLSKLSLLGTPIGVVVPSCDQGTEMYGPLDDIFDELAGKVVRFKAAEDFRARCYQDRICLFRQTHPYVSKALRESLEKRLGHRPELLPDRQKVEQLRASGKPIVLIGLRVENRTVSGIDGFVRQIVKSLSSICPSVLTVVLDGFNSWSHDSQEVYHTGEHRRAKHLPIDVERELARKLAATAPPEIEIVDLVGATVDRSLFWSFSCDCFVAIWGAGLAKYRWAANRPGFVYSSAWNLQNRHDLAIYHDPAIMEDPSELSFVDVGHVRDLPEEEILSFQTDQPIESYYNFEVNHRESEGKLLEFAARYLSSSIR